MRTSPSGGVQLIGCVKGPHREFGVFGGYQDADLDLGGRDHLYVYPLAGQGLEHLQRHAGVALKMFETLAAKGINIQVISTSEIKISVLVAAEYTELAVRALHTAYELDAA